MENNRAGGNQTLEQLIADVHALAITSIKQAWRLVTVTIGATVLLIGIALLALPGPGVVVILIGLAILSVEFAWARHLLHRMKESAAAVERQVRRAETREPPPPAAPPGPPDA